jgi:hypothetical protein
MTRLAEKEIIDQVPCASYSDERAVMGVKSRMLTV